MGLRRFLVSNGFSVHQADSMLGISEQAAAAVGSLTATGTNLATAFALQHSVGVFGTVAAGTGALLPIMEIGDEVWVANAGANALLLYPPQPGQNFNVGAADAAYSLAAGKAALIKRVSTLRLVTLLSA